FVEIREQLTVVTAGSIELAERRPCAREAEQRKGSVRMSPQRLPERLDRLPRPAGINQHLAEQLRRRFQRFRQAEWWRQLQFTPGGGAQRLDRVILVTASQLDQRR